MDKPPKTGTRGSDWALYKRLIMESRRYWHLILASFLIGLLASPLALLGPLPLKIAADHVIGDEPLPGLITALIPGNETGPGAALAFAIGLVLFIAVIGKIREAAAYLLTTYTSEKLVRGFRARLFRHAQRLSVLYHDRKGSSDSLYRIQWDAPAISYVAVYGITPFATALFTVVGMLFVTWRLNPQIALIALATVPLLLGGFRLYRSRLRESSTRLKEFESRSFSVIQEVLGALRVVKAFGQEEREQERFLEQSSRSIGARLRYCVIDSCFGSMLGLIIAGATASALYVGVSNVISGAPDAMSLGDLLVVMAYMGMLMGPLSRISQQAGSLQSHFAGAERAFALLDTDPEVPEKARARPIERATGDIEFREVTFSYTDDSPAIREISFHIPPTTRVGIAGHTGSGKSTLMSLLLRFYDPTVGGIRLDGIDLRDYRLVDLREQFAMVLQEPVLFSTSIYENILYGRPDASREEVENAARLANAHDFICAFGDGYETQVGDRGMSLSGGERQRISLARAFLKDAPILVLDEPTSSVDIATESGIMDAVKRLMEGRTTFIIAHRLSTLEHCDICLHLADGRLVELEDLRTGGEWRNLTARHRAAAD